MGCDRCSLVLYDVVILVIVVILLAVMMNGGSFSYWSYHGFSPPLRRCGEC